MIPIRKLKNQNIYFRIHRKNLNSSFVRKINLRIISIFDRKLLNDRSAQKHCRSRNVQKLDARRPGSKNESQYENINYLIKSATAGFDLEYL